MSTSKPLSTRHLTSHVFYPKKHSFLLSNSLLSQSEILSIQCQNNKPALILSHTTQHYQKNCKFSTLEKFSFLCCSIEIHQAEHAFQNNLLRKKYIDERYCAMLNKVYTRMNYNLSMKLVFFFSHSIVIYLAIVYKTKLHNSKKNSSDKKNYFLQQFCMLKNYYSLSNADKFIVRIKSRYDAIKTV